MSGVPLASWETVDGKSAFHRAVLAGLLVPGFEWCCLVREVFRFSTPADPSNAPLWYLAAIGLSVLAVTAVVLLILGYDFLQMAPAIVRSVLAAPVSDEAWQAAVDRSPRRLPRAALAGSAAWIAYRLLLQAAVHETFGERFGSLWIDGRSARSAG